MKQTKLWMLAAILLCGFSQTAQAQTKFCTSYAEYKSGQQVDKSQKGLVIYKGRKYLNK